MSLDSAAVYSFGTFSVSASKHLLECDGQPVHLKPKVLDVLLAFLQSDGNLLTKDELMQRLWPESFVEENNLAVCVAILRKTLKEHANGDRFIETVPRRGYRFVAEVKKIETLISDHNKQLKTPDECAREVREKLKGKTLAVLPFQILGTSENLGLIIADAIITTLGNHDVLKVRPTSAVRRYLAGDFDSAGIGEELGVDFILEGIGRILNEQVRLTLQLWNAKTGITTWADKFDGAVDAFSMEDSIACRVSCSFGLPPRPLINAGLSDRR